MKIVIRRLNKKIRTNYLFESFFFSSKSLFVLCPLINFKCLLLLRFIFLELFFFSLFFLFFLFVIFFLYFLCFSFFVLGFFSLFFLICLFVTGFPYFFWYCFTASLYFFDSGLSFPCLLFNTALRTKNMIKVIPNRINKLVISCPGFLIN